MGVEHFNLNGVKGKYIELEDCLASNGHHSYKRDWIPGHSEVSISVSLFLAISHE